MTKQQTINYIIDFFKSHKVNSPSLEDCFQITMTLVNTTAPIAKAISQEVFNSLSNSTK